VVKFMPQLLNPPRKSLQYTLDRRLGADQRWSVRSEETNPCACLESNPSLSTGSSETY